MERKQGSLSINSENIFPVIKKWLYSDHDIFVREMISNASDAITKLKKIALIGEYTLPDNYTPKISVVTNDKDKTLTFTDNGLGMTADEVEEYIAQIAFSGAEDFLNKYKDKANEDQIIGHFGLGFYSAFMVADKVTIETLSYKENSEAVYWESDGSTDYIIDRCDKTDVGTKITLFMSEDSYEFSNEYRVRETLNKYCSFMPYEIYLEKEGAEPEYEEVELDEKDEDGNKKKEKVLKKPEPVNDINPLWNKHPNECTEEEYKEFYRKVFLDFKDPLFYIHLNMDYPFNLKGILYFPRIGSTYEPVEGTIKLYNNQVFIADNIKEVIPEYLLLLKGVIDCPDLPLNVSRSALQNDGFVKKISDYISKKVADKLSGMYKTDLENYEKYWDDINPFIKFGCLKDDKFAEKMLDFIIYKDLNDKYLTIDDILKENESSYKNTVFYVTDKKEQSQYIEMFKNQNINAVILPHNIDSPFISFVEAKKDGIKFLRIDADVAETFKEETSEDELKDVTEKLSGLFKKALSNDSLNVKVEKLKNAEVASMITISEQSRRMADMMKMYGMSDMEDFSHNDETLVLNINHPIVASITDKENSEETDKVCAHLYDLALLSHGLLSPERMSAFIARSNELLQEHIV